MESVKESVRECNKNINYNARKRCSFTKFDTISAFPEMLVLFHLSSIPSGEIPGSI